MLIKRNPDFGKELPSELAVGDQRESLDWGEKPSHYRLIIWGHGGRDYQEER